MILTAVFAVIIIYLFAICGYLFIQDDFLMEVNTKPLGIDFDNGKTRYSFFSSVRHCEIFCFIDTHRKEHIFFFFFLFFQLLDMIFRDATLLQVTQSVTRNGKSIMLTMMLALILIYLFSVMGFIFFRDDFLSHIQTRLFSPSYSHHRYRRTNSPTKTTTLTRRSSCRHCHYRFFVFCVI